MEYMASVSNPVPVRLSTVIVSMIYKREKQTQNKVPVTVGTKFSVNKFFLIQTMRKPGIFQLPKWPTP